MEPPQKILRIWERRTILSDEQHPDYVKAKQKQQKRLKNKFEGIFAKFESMHESMSDEIDFDTDEIVVDRGHLRRMDRQAMRPETRMLNSLFALTEGHKDEKTEEEAEDEQEEDLEISEDELAPKEQPKPQRRRTKIVNRSAQQLEENTEGTDQVSEDRNTAQDAPAQNQPQQTPAKPVQLPDLLRVQFPNTPEGQALQQSLNLIVNSALQQAVVSGILSQTHISSSPLATPQILHTTPIAVDDEIAPATDRKWYFPPLSSEMTKERLYQSSPIPPPASRPAIAPRAILQRRFKVPTMAVKTSPRRPRNLSHYDTLEQQEANSIHLPKSHAPDDPRDQVHESQVDDEQSVDFPNQDLAVERKKQPTRLPAPTDTESDRSQDGEVPEADDDLGAPQNVVYDEDEQDLLSLCGGETGHEPPVQDFDVKQESSPSPDIAIMSIEVDHLTGDDGQVMLQEDGIQTTLLEDAPSDDDDLMLSTIVVKVPQQKNTEDVFSSPSNPRKRKRQSIDKQKAHDTCSTSQWTCDICHAVLSSERRLESHIKNPPRQHLEALRNQGNPDTTIATEADREPTTPIQREQSESPEIDLSYLTPARRMPRKARQVTTIHASGAKSTPSLARKLSRKQIKNSWTTMSAKKARQMLVKQRSLFELSATKRIDIDIDAVSDDELAF